MPGLSPGLYNRGTLGNAGTKIFTDLRNKAVRFWGEYLNEVFLT